MNLSQIVNNVSAGEISPLYQARAEAPQYNYGAKRIENYLVMPSGGLRKRPGSWFDGNTKNSVEGRLIPFQLSDGSYVQAEFTALKVRFWSDEFTLFGAPLEVTTPFTLVQLPLLRFAVSKNVLWIVHPLHAPQIITWNGTTFALTTPTFTAGIFDSTGNYPSCIAFDAGRLWLGPTINKPNAIYGSKPPNATTGADQYLDFTIGASAGDAIYLQENDTYGSSIQWIAANRLMLSATDRAVWCDTGEVPTPATFDMNIVSNGGSASFQGIGSNDVLVYIARGGKKLHGLIFQSSDDSKSFVDIDLTETADHILVPRVVDLCVMDYPIPIVWIALADGTLASCTLDLRKGIIAFARHAVGGLVESVSIGPGSTYDVLWMIVNRDGVRCVEHILFDDIIGATLAESHYVDSGLRLTYETATKTIAGLTHLIGKEVTALGEGARLPTKTVSESGEVEYDREVSLIHVGLPIVSIFEPVSYEHPANGTSLAKKRRIEKAYLQLYASYGGKMGINGTKLQSIGYQRYGSCEYGSPLTAFTGYVDVTVSGTIDTESAFQVYHDEPVPFTILALILRVAPMEA